MWSTCSIETGHASTHAPHVTQSQIISSGTPLPTIGSAAPREHLVADAHDQQLRREELPGRIGGARVLAAAALGAREPSSISFHVGRDRRGAEAHSSSGTSKRSGSSRPRARVRANQTFTAAVAMWRCFECGR